MITVNLESCDGCGACLAVCPTGAIFLEEGNATVDDTLCRECEACVAACPHGAIALSTPQRVDAGAAYLPALQVESGAIRVQVQPALVPGKSRFLSAVGSALTWAARELLPALVDLLDGQTDRSHAGGGARGSTKPATPAKGSARPHRHRQRRGRS